MGKVNVYLFFTVFDDYVRRYGNRYTYLSQVILSYPLSYLKEFIHKFYI